MSKLQEIKRIPLNGTFELTARCNLKCKMCLVRIDDKRMKELGGRERTSEEWIDMARQVRDAGTIGLLITGGEPMLRSDFCEIYEEIAKMGFMITLYTNATMVTNKIMDTLSKYPPHRIGITIYGASSETYEKICGDKNAYQRAIEGINFFMTLPAKISIRTTIIKDNLDDLDKIKMYVEDLDENITFNVSRLVTKGVRGALSDVESCRLTPEESAELLCGRAKKLINELCNHESKKKHKIYTEYNKENIVKDKYVNNSLYGCAAGITDYTISWDGKLIGCQLLQDCYTEPFETSFTEEWNEFPNVVKKHTLNEICSKCSISDNCCACPATRLSESGSIYGLPKYICEEAKIINKMAKDIEKKIYL